MSDSRSLLKSALLQSTINEDTKLAVKAEDIEQGGGIDFSKHYFEPKVGSSYTIKFLPNPGADPIIHRSVYKNLPDPERKGKTFHYVSSGSSATCKALELFFELHQLKKAGDSVAEKKIDNYLSRTNQACSKIQILQSPDATEIGIIRMFAFSTFGPNATVANLVKLKIDPTEAQMKADFEKEDIYNIFGSSVLNLICDEATYGETKGRDYTKSNWAPKPKGAMVKVGDKTHVFSQADIVNGEIKPEVEPFFDAFVDELTNPDYDIYNYFAYKVVDDARNSEETNKYLKSVNAKVDEIIPIIREKSLTEIAAYGKAASAPSAEGAKKDKAGDVMASSIPAELQGSVMDAVKNVGTASSDVNTSKVPVSDEVADILAD